VVSSAAHVFARVAESPNASAKAERNPVAVLLPAASRSYLAIRSAARALEVYAAWRRGQREEALRLLQASEREVTGHILRYAANQTIRWWIGDLLEEMGRPSEAAPYFYSATFYDPIAWERLGMIYEELGEIEKARDSYEKFLVAWQDAEPALRPRVERARQRLAGVAPLKRD